MVVFPLLYLFWRKKNWRLLLGAAILVILVIAYFLPNVIAHSMVKNRLEEELEKVIKRAEKIPKKLKKILSPDYQPEKEAKNSDQIALEKELRNLEKEKKDKNQKFRKEHANKKASEAESSEFHSEMEKIEKIKEEKQRELISKWSGEDFLPPFLFCGKEFGEELKKEREYYGIGKYKLVRNVIDLGQKDCQKSEVVREKILAIIKAQEMENKLYNVVLLENVDQITNAEVENLLLGLSEPLVKASEWKYQQKFLDIEVDITPNLTRFVFITTASAPSSRLPDKFQRRFRLVEPFLDQHSLLLFIVSGSGEVIIFWWLMKKKKKRKKSR